MVKQQDRRIVCIGMGFLMEQIADNYIEYLGEGIADQMIATSLDEADIPRKQAKFPFPIQYGDNPGALAALEPTMILFAPPPKAARQLTEEELLPYFEVCRREGRPLPMLVVFPPQPAGQYYLETLGADVEIVHGLPNPVITICGKRYPGEGVNFLTFPEGHQWSEEHIEEVKTFFAPTGSPMLFTPAKTGIALGAGAVVNPLSMFIYTIADAWQEDAQRIAEAMRADLEKQAQITPAEDVPHTGLFAGEKAALISGTVSGFFAGLLRFLTERGFSWEEAKGYLYPFGDLYLHSYMRESRAVIEEKRKGQATKGGVVELAVRLYEEKMQEKLSACALAVQDGAFDDAWPDAAEQFAYESAVAVAAHAAKLG